MKIKSGLVALASVIVLAPSAFAGGMGMKPAGGTNVNLTYQSAGNFSSIHQSATLVNVPISVPIAGSNSGSSGSAGSGASASAGGSAPKDCGCHGSKPSASAPGVATATANASSGGVNQGGNPATSTIYASPVLTQYGNTVTQGNAVGNATYQTNH
jgi:hypothetical protein